MKRTIFLIAFIAFLVVPFFVQLEPPPFVKQSPLPPVSLNEDFEEGGEEAYTFIKHGPPGTVLIDGKFVAPAIFCETDLEGPCWYNDEWGRKESATAYKWYDSEDIMGGWRDEPGSVYR